MQQRKLHGVGASWSDGPRVSGPPLQGIGMSGVGQINPVILNRLLTHHRYSPGRAVRKTTSAQQTLVSLRVDGGDLWFNA